MLDRVLCKKSIEAKKPKLENFRFFLGGILYGYILGVCHGAVRVCVCACVCVCVGMSFTLMS